MGVTRMTAVRGSTVVRGVTAVLGLIAFIVLACVGGPDQKSYVVAAILTGVIVYSNWRELTEEAAHMAHHMPHNHIHAEAQNGTGGQG